MTEAHSLESDSSSNVPPDTARPAVRRNLKLRHALYGIARPRHLVYFDAEYGRLLCYNTEMDDHEVGGSAATDNTATEAHKQGASGDAATYPLGAKQV
jgi:hypothetical protein